MTDAHPSTSAWGAGLATIATASGRVLDTIYPAPLLGAPPAPAAPGTAPLSASDAAAVGAQALLGAASVDELRGVHTLPVLTVIESLDEPPADAHDAYLRLHLISHRLARPRTINVDGIFAVLPNVVWTSAGPCDVDDFAATRTRFLTAGRPLAVTSVDKFPR